MPRTPVFTEVVAGTPELLFGAVKNHHEWVLKLIPHVFTEGDRHEGDGDVGSVYHYDIHEDTHDAHGGTPKIKMVMEDYNEQTFSYVVDYQGDPWYSHLKFHHRFLLGPSPNTTYLKWLIDYSPLTDKTPPPDDLVAFTLLNITSMVGSCSTFFNDDQSRVTNEKHHNFNAALGDEK